MAPMQLSTRPDFDAVKDRWRHFWAGEVKGRPLVWGSATRPNREPGDLSRRYWHAVHGSHEYMMREIDRWLAATEFLGEAVPLFGPDYGPDQFAAWLGSEFAFSDDSPTTDWVKPVIDDWEAFLPLRLDPDGKLWQGILGYSRKLAAHGDGRYLVAVGDLHSNMDAFLALRGSQRLCMDFYDRPREIAEAMRQVRMLYVPVYEALFEAGAMGRDRGSCGWAPFWSDGRFATIQCDFLALLSPELSRKYVIPALREEAAFLDHCVYHLDGPSCLPHLDDILAIDDIDVIQWVPGAGRPPMHEWMDVLKRCQDAGKGLELCDVTCLETVKKIARELKPGGLVYHLSVTDRDEARRIIDWLERNT
jgi:5-methyltetrahydrofolate--homocysteine methyltransferase